METVPTTAQIESLIQNKSEVRILGYSDSEKGCYWTVYQHGDEHFIGLRDEPPSDTLWYHISPDVVENYNENPETECTVLGW